ncbi:unnamed protein product [Rotaria magnacalcarata]|uniref:DRBM domain-containing protein n=2 Tax=Rotaria magnacalcarata TaxID=392030 RepID=A0A815M319_9BILA|nr:unnamed protein product [Rotaria magnacalcarata]CAF1414879.1 unnamed protein product [Rotaria magnacalcarata]CAF2150502.1 unnamed protein product [Rotaria magnacalcarata]CAF3811209.1 unnamed protein product [Rotaria magnacalcarata]
MQQDQLKISPLKAINDLARENKIVAEYQLEKESGPAHAKVYSVRLRLGDKEYVGSDRSIKLAQRAAAQIALNDQTHLLSKDKSDKGINLSKHPTVTLNAWAAQNHIPIQYVLLDQHNVTTPNNISSNFPCIIFYYRLYLGQDLHFDGHDLSHQLARINCAYHALNFIRENEKSILKSLSSIQTQIQSKSPISIMYERAKQLGLSVQIKYNEPLTITYLIGEQYSAMGTGATKNAAKRIAAEQMLEILPLSSEVVKQKHIRKHGSQHKKFIEQKGSVSYSLTGQINPITRLYQIGRARDIKIEFNELENENDDKTFHFHVKFGDDDSADGYGKNKQIAKRSAAENLLSKLNPNLLESIDVATPASLPVGPIKSLLKRDENVNEQHEKKHVHFIEDELVEHEKKTIEHQSSITIKQQLINACQKLNLDIQYDDQLIADNEQCETILTLSKDDRILAKFRAHAPSVIRAQENVSLTAWRNLQQLFNGSIQLPKRKMKKRCRPAQTPIPVEQDNEH